MFGEGRYFQRFQAGEFGCEVKDLGPPLKRAGEAFGPDIREQIVRYFHWGGRGLTVAIMHQRAGDSLGNPAAGTWADPKFVFHNGTRYKFSPKADGPPR